MKWVEVKFWFYRSQQKACVDYRGKGSKSSRGNPRAATKGWSKGALLAEKIDKLFVEEGF